MRPRSVLIAVLAGGALAAAAGAGSGSAAAPGNTAKGKALYLQAGIFCASCHTLKAAGSTGRDGPDLDKAKAGYAQIVDVVSKGSKASKRWPTGMPGYAHAGELTTPEIRDLAAFVYAATHK